MPNVLCVDGFKVFIYFPPTEHGPPHVHVSKGGGSAVIMLPAGRARIELRESYGMSPASVRKAIEIVEENADLLTSEWRRIHG